MPVLAVDLLWLAWVVSWVAAMAWSAPVEKRAGLKRELPSRILVLAGVVYLFGLYTHPFPLAPVWKPGETWAWVFVLLTAAGFAFAWWARIHLGNLWSASVSRKAEHRVIDTGPYRFVRHPIYTGLILAGFATAIEIGTAAALLGAALLAAGWYLRARLEEEFLCAELGPDYERYAARTAMLVPFVRL